MSTPPSTAESKPGYWNRGPLPPNARLGDGSVILGELPFKRFQSKRPDALCIGAKCTMDGVHFAVGREGRIKIGDYCYFTNAVLLCELELQIGNYVMIGWNTTIADTDFHPLEPAERVADALACSPLAQGRPRPTIPCRAVVIEDDVWIGPNVTVLKGVRLGQGSFIEAGSLVTKDVPPHSRVLGNPAQVVGQIT